MLIVIHTFIIHIAFIIVCYNKKSSYKFRILTFQRIIFCDVTKEKVFEEGSHNEGFDIIIASLVFDVVAINSKMYKQALSNVLQYLVSDGVIIIHGSIGEHTYTVGSAALPAMEATEEMLMKIFQDLNLEIVRWELCVKLTTHYYCILKKN